MPPTADDLLDAVVSDEVVSLAGDLALAFFEDVDGAEVCGTVDDALAAALDVVERFDPTTLHRDLGDLAEAEARVAALMRECFEVVSAVAYRQVTRADCRQRAALAFEHVVEAFGTSPEHEPLLVALAALHALPSGPEQFALATSPRPDPEVPFEAAVAAALADDIDEGLLLAAVAAAAFVMPVLSASLDDAGLALQFVPLLTEDGPAVCTWTSEARFNEYHTALRARTGSGGSWPEQDAPTGSDRTVSDGVYRMMVRGDELGELCPSGHAVVVNPGSLLCLTVTEAQIQRLVSMERPAPFHTH